MSADFSFDALAAKLAGVAGALVSLKFLNGSWTARVSTAVLGAILSYYVAPSVSTLAGLPLGLTGFLCGLFGMAIMSRAWEWVQTTPVGALWQLVLEWLQRLTGTGNGSEKK